MHHDRAPLDEAPTEIQTGACQPLERGVEAAERFIGRASIPIYAPSLGGIESLMTRPALTSHSGMDPDERRGIGISDGLIRVSIGIEATAEIIEDFEQALG